MHYFRGMKRLSLLLMQSALLAVLLGCQPTPEERIGRAQAFMAEADYRAAVIELKNALRRDGDNAEARLLLARSSAQLGDFPTAISEYERVLGLGETDDTVWLGLGTALLKQGRAAEIVERVLPNLSETSTGVDSLVFQGDVMAVLGNLADAEKLYSSALELEPDKDTALVGMAVVEAGRGNSEGADSYVNRAIDLNPDSAFAWRAKGNFERTRRNYAEAANAYSTSASKESPHTPLADQFITRVNHIGVQLDSRKFDEAAALLDDLQGRLPGHPLINFLRGRLAYGTGDFEQAQSYLQEYLAQVPNDLRGQAILGAVNFSQNYYRQAEMFLRQAVSQNTGGDVTRRLLAETQLRLNKPDEALQSLQSFDSDSLDDPILLAMLGRAQLGLGNKDAAVAYLEQGVNVDPDNPASQLSLAVGLLAADDIDRAVNVLENMPDIDDPEFRRETLLAAAYLRRNDRDAAIAVTDSLIDENQDSATAFVIAGRLRQSLGDTDAARESYQQAVALDADSTAALYGLGNLALTGGDESGAESWYTKALNADAGFMPALVRLTQILTPADRLDELEVHIQAAIAAKPTELTPHVLHARGAIVKGRYDEALEIVRRARETHADAPLLDYAEGLALVNSGQVELGLRKLALAADAAPNTPSIHSDLARYRLVNGDYSGAEAAISRYRELQPQRFAGLALQSEAQARTGKADEARRELAAYRVTYGESVDLQVLEGDIEMYDDQAMAALEYYVAASEQLWSRPIVLRLVRASQAAGTDHAVTALSRWLSENPDDLQIRRTYAQVLESRGEGAAAMREYERVLEQSSTDAVSLNNLAWQYMQEGRSGAVELAERAHELVPDNGNISDTLGWVLYQDGQLERAEEILRQAASQSPDNPEIKYHLAAVLVENGQNSEAKSLLAEVLATEQAFSSREQAEELAKRL